MSGLRKLPGDEPTSRATKFVTALRAIKEAARTVEELEDGLFGYQRREIVTARLSIRHAEQRLVSVANLKKPAD